MCKCLVKMLMVKYIDTANSYLLKLILKLVILKQDKGRGIAILNCSKYIEKCLPLLDSNQFTEIYTC